MGNDQSRGTNEDTIDRFVSNRTVQNRVIERALRLVERPRFLPMTAHVSAPFAMYPARYDAREFNEGPLRVSSMDVYAQVLEYLRIRRGMTVLNVGTGSGFLSTVLGVLLGDFGTNHGVEIYPNLIKYANNNVIRWVKRKVSTTVGFAKPVFRLADILDPDFWRAHAEVYDRIYVSFVITDRNAFNRILRMLKVGGILVAPSQEQMCRYTRVSQNEVVCEFMGRVNFATQVIIPPEDRPPVPQFDRHPTAVVRCRQSYRHEIRRRTYPRRVVRRANRLTYRLPIGGRPVSPPPPPPPRPSTSSSTAARRPIAPPPAFGERSLDQVMQDYLERQRPERHAPENEFEAAWLANSLREEAAAEERLRREVRNELAAARVELRAGQRRPVIIQGIAMDETTLPTLQSLMRRLASLASQSRRNVPMRTPINHRETPTAQTLSIFLEHVEAWELELDILPPRIVAPHGIIDNRAVASIRRRVQGIEEGLRQATRRSARENDAREIEEQLVFDQRARLARREPERSSERHMQFVDRFREVVLGSSFREREALIALGRAIASGSDSEPTMDSEVSMDEEEYDGEESHGEGCYDDEVDPDATTLELFDNLEDEQEKESTSPAPATNSAPKKSAKKSVLEDDDHDDPYGETDPECTTLDLLDNLEDEMEQEEEESDSAPGPSSAPKTSNKKSKEENSYNDLYGEMDPSCTTLDMLDDLEDEEEESSSAPATSSAPQTTSKASKKNKKKKNAKAKKKKNAASSKPTNAALAEFIRTATTGSYRIPEASGPTSSAPARPTPSVMMKRAKPSTEPSGSASNRHTPSVMMKRANALHNGASSSTPSSAPMKPSVMMKRAKTSEEPSSSASNRLTPSVMMKRAKASEASSAPPAPPEDSSICPDRYIAQIRATRARCLGLVNEADDAPRRPRREPVARDTGVVLGWSTSSEDSEEGPSDAPLKRQRQSEASRRRAARERTYRAMDEISAALDRQQAERAGARRSQYRPLNAPTEQVRKQQGGARDNSSSSGSEDEEPWWREPRNRRWEAEMEVEGVPEPEEEEGRIDEMLAMLRNARPGRIGLPPVPDEDGNGEDSEDEFRDRAPTLAGIIYPHPRQPTTEPTLAGIIYPTPREANTEPTFLAEVMTPDPMDSETEPTLAGIIYPDTEAGPSTSTATQTEHSPPSPLPPFDNSPGPSMTEQPANQTYVEAPPFVRTEPLYPRRLADRNTFIHETIFAPPRYLSFQTMRNVWQRNNEQDMNRRMADEVLRVERERNEVLRQRLGGRPNPLSPVDAIAQQRRLLELANNPNADPQVLERERQRFFDWRRHIQAQRMSLRVFRLQENLNEEDSRVNAECDRRFPDTRNVDPRIRVWQNTFLTAAQIVVNRRGDGLQEWLEQPAQRNGEPVPPVDEEVNMFITFEENVQHSDADEALTGDSGGSGTEYEEVADDPNVPGPSNRAPTLRRVEGTGRSKKIKKYGGLLARFSERRVGDIAMCQTADVDAEPTTQERRRFNELRRRQKESEHADLLLSFEQRNEAIVRSNDEYLARIDALDVPENVKTFIKNMDEKVELVQKEEQK